MQDRIIKCFTLSQAVVEALKAAASASVVPLLMVDKAGLFPADYDAIRAMLPDGASLSNDAALLAAYRSKGPVLAAYHKARRGNLSPGRAVNMSRFLETVIWKGLEALKEDALAGSAGRSRRNDKKTA